MFEDWPLNAKDRAKLEALLSRLSPEEKAQLEATFRAADDVMAAWDRIKLDELRAEIDREAQEMNKRNLERLRSYAASLRERLEFYSTHGAGPDETKELAEVVATLERSIKTYEGQ